ncbi:Smr domain-containing protein [Heracleum sosnowskyi]|uniref:Smr domain-containing protein n=1 Tax=Heracleum sosnowskyi TaxID=360622 RepID=A0AAD8MCH5_9APIA|nr:Smr domain-containing protein [Heracleum sosnowskyi]
MSARKFKNAGWAAYNSKQQQPSGLKSEADDESYPPISSTAIPKHHTGFVKNFDIPGQSFSSVLLPSANFPTLGANKDIKKSLMIGTSRTNEVILEKCHNNVHQSCEKLKELYPWAEKGLMEDIMEAVNNDINKASDLLKEMVSSTSLPDKKETEVMDFKYNAENFYSENNTFLADINLTLRETQDLVRTSYAHQNGIVYKNKELTDVNAALEGHPDHSTSEIRNRHSLSNIPVEPEWEEDDVYLINRKDAMRTMRLASRHSKAASDAYLRGDHISAQQYSTKAREEWKEAEKYNAMAAKEILRKRNCENDLWKLDLHGLHASEAVQALKEHLQKIESQVAPSTNLVDTTNMVRSVSLDSLGMYKQKASFRPRSTVVEVITGIGLHSRGQAALPSAIETFLSENRYHYDKARPGMIAVRPKFRRV